jgi:hypothetical protein
MSERPPLHGPAGPVRKSVREALEAGEIEPTGNLEPVPGKCNAANRFGRYCPNNPMPNGACYHHGGETPRGLALPQTTHGRYSRDLPADLLGRFERANDDPELLSMRSEVALVDARLSELLAGVGSGDSGAGWVEMRRLWREFRRAQRANNVNAMFAAIEQFEEVIRNGFAHHLAWTEIGTLIDRRARLVEQERRRLDQLEQSIPLPQALTMLRTVLDAIERHVPDPDIRAAIGAELGGIATVDARPLAARSSRRRRA